MRYFRNSQRFGITLNQIRVVHSLSVVKAVRKTHMDYRTLSLYVLKWDLILRQYIVKRKWVEAGNDNSLILKQNLMLYKYNDIGHNKILIEK
jgi:hypothetical protein